MFKRENPFHWTAPLDAPESGFKWVEAPITHAEGGVIGRYLTAAKSRDERVPFDPPNNLFMKFAKLSGDEYSIQNFANQTGYLGIMEIIRSGEDNVGESREGWQKQTRAMYEAVYLADAIAGRRTPRLHKLVSIHPHTGTVRYVSESKESTKNLPYENIGRGDLVAAGRLVLRDLINERLDGSTHMGVAGEGRLGEGRLREAIYVKSLQGVLWVQFMQSALEGRITRCAQCQELMAINRSDQKTCSVTCRKLRSLQNRAKAKKKRSSNGAKTRKR